MRARKLLGRRPPAVDERHDTGPVQLYPISELPHRPFMPRKKGKPINKFTALRWALHEKRGVRLRSVMIGGVRCTCDQWACEFFENLSRNKGGTKAIVPRSDHLRAKAELTVAGL